MCLEALARGSRVVILLSPLLKQSLVKWVCFIRAKQVRGVKNVTIKLTLVQFIGVGFFSYPCQNRV